MSMKERDLQMQKFIQRCFNGILICLIFERFEYFLALLQQQFWNLFFAHYFLYFLIDPLPRCSCWCVGDLKPSVLANDGWMDWLNGDVLSIQIQPLNKALKTRMK